MKARLCWSMKSGRAQRHGTWMDRALVEAWVEHANATWPDILHWLEPQDLEG